MDDPLVGTCCVDPLNLSCLVVGEVSSRSHSPAVAGLEDRLIGSLDVPLNLDGNSRNSFYLQLKAARAAAKRRAEDLPVFPNPGVGGR